MTSTNHWIRYGLIGTSILMILAVLFARWWTTPEPAVDDGWRPLPQISDEHR